MRAAFSGMKESEGSHLSVLSALFSPPTKRKTKGLGLSEQEDAEQMARFVDRLTRLIDLSGVHEKVAVGEYLNILTSEVVLIGGRLLRTLLHVTESSRPHEV